MSSGASTAVGNFRRLDAGSRTVEGNVSGSRAAALEQQRLRDAEQFELRKEQHRAKTSSNLLAKCLKQSFRTATKASAAEQAFSTQTVGLVTAEEFALAAKHKNKASGHDPYLEENNDNNGVLNDKEMLETEEERLKREKAERKARKRKLKEKKKQLSTLSFATDEQEEDENSYESDQEQRQSTKKEKKEKTQIVSKKDPTVDTSFLPDAQRDEQRAQERQRLQQEWLRKQEEIKKEKLEITFSYWDGSGHRRSIVCQKGDSIGHFLQQALTKQLGKEFRNLQGLTSDELMYVKEDLILPHDVTFYDLIATKARGKSGPLFYFDVHDDVRLGPVDSRVEKEESHPGKVVERKWYERNKHIFPASRWQIYDPTLETYGAYKIGGK